MFHQNICMSCLPLLTFLLNLEFIQCYNMILFAWLGVAWTQTDKWTYEHTKPSGLVMFEDKCPDNLRDFECKHYVHYILLYLYVWVCVWIYVWTCVHTWTIHRFGQGITSIRTVQTRPCHGMGKMSQSSYFMQTAPKYKLCREHTRALTKHTPGHSHTLSYTLVHSRTQDQIGLFSCSSQLSGPLITHQTDNNLGDNMRLWIHTHSREQGSVCRTGRSSEGARRGVRADGLRTCEDGEEDWKKRAKKKLQNDWKCGPGPLTSHHEGTLMHRSCI